MTYAFTVCRNPTCKTTKHPGYADRGLCTYHENAGLTAIEALPRDFADLFPLLREKIKRPGASGGKFGPSDVLDLSVDALMREIAYTAVLWEIPVRERARLSDPPHQQDVAGYRDLVRACTILKEHYPVLIALGPTDHINYDRKPDTADGVDAVSALTKLHHRARGRIGFTKRVETVEGTCPCGRDTLRHETGSNTVFCATCRARWSWDEYVDAVHEIPAGS